MQEVTRLSMALLLCLLFAGCRTAKREPTQWRRPELLALDEVLLRFEGSPVGSYVVEFVCASKDWPAPQELQTIDLRYSHQLSQALRGLKVVCSPPLTEAVHIRLHPDDGQGGTATKFRLDPRRLQDRLFETVDLLRGAQYEQYLRAIQQVRTRYSKKLLQSPVEALVELRRGLMAALKEQGASRQGLLRLRHYFAALQPQQVGLDSELAERLMPLRQTEALLCEPVGPIFPWGEVAPMLAQSFNPTAACTVPAGWTSLGRRDLRSPTALPNRPDKTIGMWKWLATQDMLDTMTTSKESGVISFAYTNYVNSTAALEANIKDFTSSVTAKLIPPRAPTIEFPPTTAIVDVCLRAFTREAVLTVAVNGGPVHRVVNTAFAALGQPDFSENDPFVVSIAVDPSLLGKEMNSVTLTMEAIPHQQPPLAMRVKEVALRVQ